MHASSSVIGSSYSGGVCDSVSFASSTNSQLDNFSMVASLVPGNTSVRCFLVWEHRCWQYLKSPLRKWLMPTKTCSKLANCAAASSRHQHD
jgi:hypothetical protein